MAAAMAAALRECAAALARQDAGWRGAVAAWAPLLGSLAGLAAQMRAVRRLPWGETPLGAFGDLRERLWRKQRGAAEALLEQLSGRRGCEGTWRANFSSSVSAVTAWQTWKPSHSLGRGFWSATRKTLSKMHFLRSLCLWTTNESCAAHQAPDREQEGLMLTSFYEPLLCSEVTTERMMN
ncbi:AFG2-interacting ribosome maturation factor isoform X2 [Colius striatus]|uniref:AFG2-interacting ribosome maturation factor isoform X2 n=1 Tax=Colius striatus TaxID=57412 RepID=UPI002B1D3256|nr:AFG2-interacting ribosome maturation factor isoform X2 [Colius striatus]